MKRTHCISFNYKPRLSQAVAPLSPLGVMGSCISCNCMSALLGPGHVWKVRACGIQRNLEGITLLQIYIKQVHGQDIFGLSSPHILFLCRPLLDDVGVGCCSQGVIGFLRHCESFQRLLVLSAQQSNLFAVSNIPCWHRETHPSSTISFSYCPISGHPRPPTDGPLSFDLVLPLTLFNEDHNFTVHLTHTSDVVW
jgi:hypothetical protein